MYRASTNTSSNEQTSPSVAIIVPVYNSFPFLEQCLHSISKQTHRNFNVFIVNDGSTDNSIDIINNYVSKDSRFILINQSSKGVSAARNIGISQALLSNNYEFISFVDSDDIINDHFLEILISASEKNNSDITICNYFKFKDNGTKEIRGTIQPSKRLSKNEFVELIFSTGRWKGYAGSGGMVWKNLFRTKCLNGVRFSEDRDCVEDELFSLELAKNSDSFYFIQNPLYGYRQHNSSIIHSKHFMLKLLNGRRKCFLTSDNLSRHIQSITASALADSFIMATKDGCQPEINLSDSFHSSLLDAYKKQLIHLKTLVRIKVACISPTILKIISIYYLSKKIKYKKQPPESLLLSGDKS